MRLSSFQSLLFLVPATFASQDKRQATTTTTSAVNLQAEAASLVSVYVPPSAYAQLTASVASAASAASVTGDPASLFLSAILATNPPAWFSSAVPPYYSSNIAALESAAASLRSEAGTNTVNTLVSTSTSETLVVTQTTNSLGSTVTTSFTSTFPVSSTHTTSSSGNAAAPTGAAQQQAGLGFAALALGLAAIF